MPYIYPFLILFDKAQGAIPTISCIILPISHTTIATIGI